MDKKFSILDSIPDLSNYESFTDRYFTKRYAVDVHGIKDNDVMIMFHSNRIALLCLAPSHFFFKNNDQYSVNFTVGTMNRLSNTVKGKGKSGGQKVLKKSDMCRIEYANGTGFGVPCCMLAILVEANEELVKNPYLLREKPDSDGFIAIMLTTIGRNEAAKNDLLSHEEYVKIKSVKTEQ